MKLAVFEKIKPSDVLKNHNARQAFIQAVEGYLNFGYFEGNRPPPY